MSQKRMWTPTPPAEYIEAMDKQDDETVLRHASVFEITKYMMDTETRKTLEVGFNRLIHARKMGRARIRITTQARPIKNPAACYQLIRALVEQEIAIRVKNQRRAPEERSQPQTSD